jgi:hypothetical protein
VAAPSSPRRRASLRVPILSFHTLHEGLIVTSVLFVERELLLHVPFREDLRRYVDTDWLLRMDR